MFSEHTDNREQLANIHKILVLISVFNNVSQKSLTYHRLTEALVNAAVVAFSCSLLFHIIGVLFDCETIDLGVKLWRMCELCVKEKIE